MRYLSGQGPEKVVEYRARAQWLFARATETQALELRAVYLDLAQQWAALAEYALNSEHVTHTAAVELEHAAAKSVAD
jgi:hypothetical protein